MAKPKSIASYIKNTVWPNFSKYIRLRDALKTTRTLTHCRCITCDKIKPIEYFDAGHWQSRRHKSTLFDEKNVNGQCKYCNKYLSGDPSAYERALVSMYGQKEVDKIYYRARNEIKKFTIEELQKINKKAKQKVEQFIRKAGE